MRPLRLLVPICGVMLLVACSTTPRGPASVPTAVKAGQSWVVTRPIVAAQVLDTCSRPSPGRDAGRITGYWAPSRQQVEQLEARLAQLTEVDQPGDFDRQYVGIEADGKQWVYVNAFRLPDDSTIDPAREAIRACGGGRQFWGALYDPQATRFSELHFNGAK